jgi:ABC-2 type transport system ATP-binding protein
VDNKNTLIMSIKVENLSKIYGQQKAINDISFEILTGEITGFVGPNGAGKSTTMKIITGFLPPTTGDVFLNGLDIITHSLEVREKIGYLPENNPLYPDLYIKEYLKYVAGIYKLGKQTNSRIEKVIQQTGLTNEINKKIGALSKGYKQRVGLAQALIHNPDILILDEPTSGLDPNQIIEIRNLISDIGKEKTVLLSTHLMQEVEAICNRIIIINKGKIVANDKVKDITKNSAAAFQTIFAEFNTEVKEKSLEKISGVRRVAKINSKKFLFESDENTDIRQNIFQYAVDNKISVLSLQEKEKSLEEIFQELTIER